MAKQLASAGLKVVGFERGPAPNGDMSVIVEIRELDAEILNSEPAPTPAPAE